MSYHGGLCMSYYGGLCMSYLGSQCMSYLCGQCMSYIGSQCMSYHGGQCMSYHGSQRMSFLGSQRMRYHHRLPLPRSGRLARSISPLPHPEHGEGGEAEMQLADVLLDAGAPRRPRHQPQVQRREAAPDAHARLRVFSRAFSLDDTRAAALALARALVRAGERMREPSRESQLTAKASALLDCRCWVALPALRASKQDRSSCAGS